MTRKAILKGRSEPIQGRSIDFEVRRLAYTGLVLLLLYALVPAATAQEPLVAANHAAPINALHMHLVAAAVSSLTTGFDPQPGIFDRFNGKDAQTRFTGVPTFEKIDYALAHSGINPVFNGNQSLFESAPVLKPDGDTAKTLRLIGDPIRAFSRLSDRFTAYAEGRSNSWRQWPMRLLMASADQFQFSIPSRSHRSVSRPVATTAARH
jgi:hypothetical protein